MARTARNYKLENRTQRIKLGAQHRPYWTIIGQGLYLGYRKGVKGGAWIARYYVSAGKYATQKLGKADDYQDANSIDVLNYFQAQEKARQFADQTAKSNAGIANAQITVKDAIANYLDWMKTHRKSYPYAKHTSEIHILPAFENRPAQSLTTIKIRQWHENLVKQPPKLKGTPIKQNYRAMPSTPEEIRARKATANRILTVLKAALNHAWRDGLIESDEPWRKVKPFRNVDAPKIRYLELSECQRLLNACPADFRQLVRAGLLTGCRYGELIRAKNYDFNANQGTLHIRETKNGKPRHVPLTQEGINFFEQLTLGRVGDKNIFLREDGEPWGTSHQIRRLKEACEKAKIKPAISFHILRHTYGSLLASKGVPLQVIAELLGHSDTRITNRHYAHLMPSFVSDTLRANLPEFEKNKQNNNVVSINNRPSLG